MNQLTWTTLPNKYGTAMTKHSGTWPRFVARLRAAGIFLSKEQCPWIKMVEFGDQRSDNGSLRTNENTKAVYGVEGDYDRGIVTIEEAITLLEKHDIKAAVYPTPSWTAEKPRWRVLCPLAQQHTPGDHAGLVARLNGSLGGILAPESFTLSQGYFYGGTPTNNYRVLATFDDPDSGQCIDELDDLDRIALKKGEKPPVKPTENEASYTTAGATPVDAADDDDIAPMPTDPAIMADLRSALTALDADKRDVWIDIGMALKSLGDPARTLWVEWSQTSDKYNAREAARTWDSFKPAHTGYQSVFKQAQDAGWINPKSKVGAKVGATASTLIDRTDAGNVALLADQTNGDLRFVSETKTWLAWTGARWEPDTFGTRAHEAALQVGQHYLDKAAEIRQQARGGAEAKERKLLEQAAAHLEAWAVKCRNKGGIESMLALARVDARFALSVNRLDTNPMLFGVANGVVDLETGALRPASRDEFVTRRSPVAFDPAATAPRFEQFITEITSAPIDQSRSRARRDLASYLQKLLGYCMTGMTREHKMFVAVGRGANGKSVLLDTLSPLMGDYFETVAPDALMAASGHGRDAERATPAMRRLAGCRLAVSSESKEGQKLDVAMVKRQTGDAFMTARGMYENTFTFEITHKVMLLTNHKPALDHVDAATKARLHLVPFDRRWNRPGDTEHDPRLPDGDKTLMDQLKSEASGILAWMVRGALAYQRHGLAPPDEVKSMTRTYFAEQDPFGLWLPTREICDASQGTLAADLFEQFRTWCVAEEFGANDAGTQKAFAAKLADKNVFSQKLNNGRRYGLKPMQSESATFCDLDQAGGDNADSEASLV